MKQRHVVHVLGTGEQQARGIALTVMNLASALDRSRYRLSVLILGEDGPVADDLRGLGVDVEAIGWHNGKSDIGGAMRFARALQQMRPDIVHLHAGGLSPRVVSKAAVGAKIVVHYHSLEEESRTGRASRRSALGADLIIANSRATARSVSGWEPRVIYPGIAIPELSRHTPTPLIFIGTAARLAPVKGLMYLIDALSIVFSANRETRAEIAGDGPERRNLEESARKAGIDDRIHFTGWVNDIGPVMSRWDIYAQPSLAEGLGIAALEAMSYGVPVVASDVGGLREIVVEEETGFLVPPRDSQALADRLIQLATDHALRGKMGAAARAHVAENFPLDRETAAIESSYEELLG